MLEYLYCLIFITLCWIVCLYVVIGSLLKGGPNVFNRKLEIQIWFNTQFVVEGIRKGIVSYIEFEFERMIEICGETQGSREKFNILEIGVGTGANFPYYPRKNSVTVLDNNPYFRDYYRSSAYENSHISLVRELTTSAEDMKDVLSGSMDCVVSTYTLAAVDDVDAVLKEVKRVLRPGGCFLFVEPVLDPDDIINSALQIMLSPLTRLYLGYDLKRSLLRNIRTTFENVEANRCNLKPDLQCFGFYTDICFRPHIHGIAIK